MPPSTHETHSDGQHDRKTCCSTMLHLVHCTFRGHLRSSCFDIRLRPGGITPVTPGAQMNRHHQRQGSVASLSTPTAAATSLQTVPQVRLQGARRGDIYGLLRVAKPKGQDSASDRERANEPGTATTRTAAATVNRIASVGSVLLDVAIRTISSSSAAPIVICAPRGGGRWVWRFLAIVAGTIVGTSAVPPSPPPLPFAKHRRHAIRHRVAVAQPRPARILVLVARARGLQLVGRERGLDLGADPRAFQPP